VTLTGADSSLTFHDTDDLTIGSVSGSSGVHTSNGDVTLTAYRELVISEDIDAGSYDIFLTSTTRSISQSGGVIICDALTLTAGGAITLNDTGNSIVSLDGVIRGGAFTLYDGTGDLTIAEEIGDGAGDITVTAGDGSLLVNDDVTASGDSNITLTGNGVSFAADVVVDAGWGTLTVDGQNGTISTATDAKLLTEGQIELVCTYINIDEAGTYSRIGGNAAETKLARTVIIHSSSPNQNIGIAGAGGNLNLTAGELERIFATNVRIGSPAGTSTYGGDLTIDSPGHGQEDKLVGSDRSFRQYL
jgi:hypothetical protein